MILHFIGDNYFYSPYPRTKHFKIHIYSHYSSGIQVSLWCRDFALENLKINPKLCQNGQVIVCLLCYVQVQGCYYPSLMQRKIFPLLWVMQQQPQLGYWICTTSIRTAPLQSEQPRTAPIGLLDLHHLNQWHKSEQLQNARNCPGMGQESSTSIRSWPCLQSIHGQVNAAHPVLILYY